MPCHRFARTTPLARDKSVEKGKFLNKGVFSFYNWKRGLGIQHTNFLS
jgi:hypothetical protein